jgi:hypothetical protein
MMVQFNAELDRLEWESPIKGVRRNMWNHRRHIQYKGLRQQQALS